MRKSNSKEKPVNPVIAQEDETMPLTTLEATTITRGLVAAQKVLDELKPAIDRLNAIYDPAVTGAKYTIDQADLDAAPNLSGLTKAQLDDGMYALTAVLRDAINNSYVQLAQLAARA
jgi:hypothetical protein